MVVSNQFLRDNQFLREKIKENKTDPDNQLSLNSSVLQLKEFHLFKIISQ